MSSTFFGLNIGASALTAFQAAVNTTANNISNVQTEGYSRQETNIEAKDALRVTAKYGSTGTGVEATSITQQRDLYYDAKYWEANASKGFYDEKLYYLDQIEKYFTDDYTQDGFSTIFNKMFNGLDTLKTNSADKTVRNQFINQAQQLCTFFNGLSTSLSEMQEDLNEEIKNGVDNINAMAAKLATLNNEINRIEVNGGHANELRDERAKLIDKLSEIVDIETKEYEIQNSNGANLGGTNYTVIANGQILVDGDEYRKLECVTRTQKVNQSDVKGLYDIRWADTKTDFAEANGTSGGSLKALFFVRDGNNNENLSGKVSYNSKSNQLIMENPSIDKINMLNIPPEGNVTIDGKNYRYTGWTAEIGDDGKISSYAFDLYYTNCFDSLDTLTSLFGKDIQCGKNYDEMGVVYYQNQINEFLRNFTEMFNAYERDGETLDGLQMGSFFIGKTKTGIEYDFADGYTDSNGEYVTATTHDNGSVTTQKTNRISSTDNSYYKLTAENIKVNDKSLKDPSYFSTAKTMTNGTDAYDIVEKLKTLQSDTTIFRGDKASTFLEKLLSDVTVDTDRTKTFYNNYSNLVNSLDTRRMSIAGVDEDEEALNLIKFQNSYNLASKVISVMAEMYDKLINECGA